MSVTKITGLIIAGGLARRMEGLDKGLQLYRGQPLLAHVIANFHPQVSALYLNVNHHPEAYGMFGLPLLADGRSGYPGPLAGLERGLQVCCTPLLAVVPCDTPHLPTDLVDRLQQALEKSRADVAVARVAQQVHASCLLCRLTVLPGLQQYLDDGRRSIMDWLATMNTIHVDFSEPATFANINTLAELQAQV